MGRTTRPEPSAPALGLRERKKRALRGELTLAALRLAKERGIENVRTEDIVAAVGVSRRTFSNYFASKYEALADRLVQRAQHSAKVLRARPRAETLWQALSAAMVAPYENLVLNDSSESREATLLVLEDATLRAELWKGELAAQRALALAVAERTGLDSERDMYPSIVAATAVAAVTTVLERWLRSKRPPPLIPMIREALELIERGLPEPARRRRAKR
ncbi:MAG TPA: helix-turn-helix domain-containing protein [Polyangiaceae bacterium]|nr:helix-turn-helix domain-containing protein [Polyangiaceae bacterium]